MLQTYLAGIALLASIGLPHAYAVVQLPYRPPSPDVLERERVTLEPEASVTAFARFAAPTGGPLPRAGWTVTVDSFEPGEEGEKVFDGDPNTFWHSAWRQGAPLPHTITVNLGGEYNVQGLTILPRQDLNHGNIGRHVVEVSTDGNNWGSPVAFGTYPDDQQLKVTAFETVRARYVRIVALSEAGNRGPWTSIAELDVYAVDNFPQPTTGGGKWGPTIDFPVVPVAAAVEQDSGNVVVWSAYRPDTFEGGSNGQTAKGIYNPNDGTVTPRQVDNIGHDMFCPGISRDINGRLIVTGGNSAPRTSIYDSFTDTWTPVALMQLGRGYQASATCSDGRIFVLGGSWNGGEGGKNGEIYDPTTDTWTLLPGCPVAPILTQDRGGVFRSDNHAWLFGWKDGSVFQAGPSRAMNWYGTRDGGSQNGVGNRANAQDQMTGNPVMYDAVAGKILTVGGSTDYDQSPGQTAAHIVTIDQAYGTPQVQEIGGLTYPRVHANSVVLPDGQVFVVGGQDFGRLFTDIGAILTPEMFDPATNSFRQLAPNTIPRTYHSVAVLLMDGTVLSGGGGLCGTCSTNHFDAQIYTPQYLLNGDGSPAARPSITGVSATSVAVGGTITVNTDSEIGSMSLVRFGSVTHALDTDQRRIPLTPNAVGGNAYTVTIPNDAGIAIPGYWMLFAMNRDGRPSVARSIQIRPS